MKNTMPVLLSMIILLLVALGCDTEQPTIRTLRTVRVKNGKLPKKTFKQNETIFVKLDISYHDGSVKINSNLTAAEDLEEVKKGEIFPGTGGTDDIPKDKRNFSLQFSHPSGFPAGKYTVNVELLDKDGNKLDSKSTDLTIESSGETGQESEYGPPPTQGGGDDDDDSDN